ncbi:hypothetical protein WJX72_006115 [[Myrmecia] bisecta]|uniref:Uncharacterized protein n=1 Tax=[Myrmecia] bisecta TaxID=41462 RepID=A0AAW1PXS1_9CHLO
MASVAHCLPAATRKTCQADFNEYSVAFCHLLVPIRCEEDEATCSEAVASVGGKTQNPKFPRRLYFSPRASYSPILLANPIVGIKLYVVAFVNETELPEVVEADLKQRPDYAEPAFLTTKADIRYRGGAVVDRKGRAVGVFIADPLPERGRPNMAPAKKLRFYNKMYQGTYGWDLLTAAPMTPGKYVLFSG